MGIGDPSTTEKDLESSNWNNNNNNNDSLFNLFAAQTELQGGSLITYRYFGIMKRKYNC